MLWIENAGCLIQKTGPQRAPSHQSHPQTEWGDEIYYCITERNEIVFRSDGARRFSQMQIFTWIKIFLFAFGVYIHIIYRMYRTVCKVFERVFVNVAYIPEFGCANQNSNGLPWLHHFSAGEVHQKYPHSILFALTNVDKKLHSFFFLFIHESLYTHRLL